ncbi:MAG: glyoxalase, partial [Pseudomonadota bacterium]
MMVSTDLLSTGTIRPFIGSRDFDQSTEFYRALGFSLEDVAPGLRYARRESIEFLLQDYHQKEWCENTMVFVQVTDAEAWRSKCDDVLTNSAFSDAKVQGPRDEPHGKVTYLSDPTGVLW